MDWHKVTQRGPRKWVLFVIVFFAIISCFSLRSLHLLHSMPGMPRSPGSSTVLNEVVAKAVNFDWRTAIKSGSTISLRGTTGVGVPGKIRSWLLSTGIAIEDDAQDHFGSEAAVKAMEEQVSGFAACMLVSDDVLRLQEWLAYHYTTLPLARLILATDIGISKRSLGRIQELKRRYQRQHRTFDFILWVNDSWVPDAKAIKAQSHGKSYRLRQETFASECMQDHKRNNATWVSLADTDEFLIFNYVHATVENHKLYHPLEWKPPDQVDTQRAQVANIRKALPDLRQTTIFAFLKGLLQKRNNVSSRCLRIPGIGFTNIVHPKLPLKLSEKAIGLNFSRFSTLSYFYPEAKTQTGFSKVMVNVAHVTYHEISRKQVHTIHNPSRAACGYNGRAASGTDYISAIFRLHHYLGTIEQLKEMAVDKAKMQTWEERMKIREHQWKPADTDNINLDLYPWIDKLMIDIGIDNTRQLLAEI